MERQANVVIEVQWQSSDAAEANSQTIVFSHGLKVRLFTALGNRRYHPEMLSKFGDEVRHGDGVY